MYTGINLENERRRRRRIFFKYVWINGEQIKNGGNEHPLFLMIEAKPPSKITGMRPTPKSGA